MSSDLLKTSELEAPFLPNQANDLRVSFEFFPPKTEKMGISLWNSIKRIEPLKPQFVSVTYGAGGSTRARTHETLGRLLTESSLKPAAHLTCIGASREEIQEIGCQYWDMGVRHIVALRGDLPVGQANHQPYPDGYAYASELVTGLKRIANFEISVAAYPETHPEATSAESDIDNLKRKLDAGADRAITQYFFGVEPFLKFMDRVTSAGIEAPIIPGILPVQNFEQLVKFSALCGTKIPDWLSDLFCELDDDPETRKLIAATVAAEQCRQLQSYGFKEFHFYTLNRADLSYAIAYLLGFRPEIIG